MATNVAERIPFKIAVHPANPTTRSKLADRDGGHYCFKKEDDQGVTRRYVAGVASGLKQDAHGERMTEECIADFLEQARTKDLLGFVNHFRNFTESIGVLSTSELLENGDWYIEVRLLDELDLEEHPLWTARVAEADDLWAQLSGTTPYTVPRVFGFSIEGWILEYKEATKEIGKLDLEGLTIVTKPAYETSVTSSLAKSVKAWEQTRVHGAPGTRSGSGSFATKDVAGAHRTKGALSDRMAAEEFEDKRWKLTWAFNDLVRSVIQNTELTVNEQKSATAGRS